MNSVFDYRQTSHMGSRSQEYNTLPSRSPNGIDFDLGRDGSSRHGNSHEALETTMGPMRPLSNDLNILLLPSDTPGQRSFTFIPTSNIHHNRSPRLATRPSSTFLRPRFSLYTSRMNREAIQRQVSVIGSLMNEHSAEDIQNTLDPLIRTSHRNLADTVNGSCSEASAKSLTSSEHMGGTSPISESMNSSQKVTKTKKFGKCRFFKMLHNIKKSYGKEIQDIQSDGQEDVIALKGIKNKL